MVHGRFRRHRLAIASEHQHELCFVVKNIDVIGRQHHGVTGTDDGTGRLQEAPHGCGLPGPKLTVVATHTQNFLGSRQRWSESHLGQRQYLAFLLETRQLPRKIIHMSNKRLHRRLPITDAQRVNRVTEVHHTIVSKQP